MHDNFNYIIILIKIQLLLLLLKLIHKNLKYQIYRFRLRKLKIYTYNEIESKFYYPKNSLSKFELFSKFESYIIFFRTQNFTYTVNKL